MAITHACAEARWPGTFRERFENRFIPEPNSGCHLWLGSMGHWGYGQVKINGKQEGAHRVAWTLYRGQIPAGMFVCHKCDVRACVNPDHLFLGTHDDNMADCARKGRNHKPRRELHGRAKLNEADINVIRASSLPSRLLGALLGVDGSTIRRIRRSETWGT